MYIRSTRLQKGVNFGGSYGKDIIRILRVESARSHDFLYCKFFTSCWKQQGQCFLRDFPSGKGLSDRLCDMLLSLFPATRHCPVCENVEVNTSSYVLPPLFVHFQSFVPLIEKKNFVPAFID